MRYPLETVITGLRELAKQRPLALENEIAQLQSELHKAQRAEEDMVSVTAAVLRQAALDVENKTFGPLDPYNACVTLRRRLEEASQGRGYLTVFEVDRKKAQLEHLRNRRDAPAPVDTTLKFLELMVRAGETHVSAHGLKQAGHDPGLLADAIVAAAGVDDAEPAR